MTRQKIQVFYGIVLVMIGVVRLIGVGIRVSTVHSLQFHSINQSSKPTNQSTKHEVKMNEPSR